MSERKLTKAQRDLLSACASGYQTVRPGGLVVKTLRALGYVEFDGHAGGGTWWLAITPAGRAALTNKEAGHAE